jgi:hypothetical protein
MIKKDLVKIDILKPNSSFGEREKVINTQIQKKIDNYNASGFFVVEHNVINKSGSSATVEFSLKKMPSV